MFYKSEEVEVDRCSRTHSPDSRIATQDESGEVKTWYPQPRRLLLPLLSESTKSAPGSPFSRHDEADNELRELWGQTKDPHLVFDGGRPLSSVSTSAGPTPSPDERASPAHWLGYDCAPVDSTGGVNTPNFSPPSGQVTPHAPPRVASLQGTPTLQDREPGQISRSSQGIRAREGPQARKIFVGGVPQDLSQDDLYAVFSEMAGVKKAWLQRYRTNGGPTPPHNHRGFGFVIFYDPSAVDQLLGNQTSKFIMLRDGRKLEVKRALSSNDLVGSPSWATSGPPPKQSQLPTREAPAVAWTPAQVPVLSVPAMPWAGGTGEACAAAAMPMVPSVPSSMCKAQGTSWGCPRPPGILLPPDAESAEGPSSKGASGTLENPSLRRSAVPSIVEQAAAGFRASQQAVVMSAAPCARLQHVPQPWHPAAVMAGSPTQQAYDGSYASSGFAGADRFVIPEMLAAPPLCGPGTVSPATVSSHHSSMVLVPTRRTAWMPAERQQQQPQQLQLLQQQPPPQPQPQSQPRGEDFYYKKQLESVLRDAMPDHYDECPDNFVFPE